MHSHKLQLPSGIAGQGARRVARNAPESLVMGYFRVDIGAQESRWLEALSMAWAPQAGTMMSA